MGRGTHQQFTEANRSNTWLIGPLLLPSDTATWNDDGDNSHVGVREKICPKNSAIATNNLGSAGSLLPSLQWSCAMQQSFFSGVGLMHD